MKLNIKYLTLLVAASTLILSGCNEENEPNEANKGVAKPVVTAEVTAATDASLSFKLTPSADVQQYAYAVLKGKDNAAPNGKDIVTGKITGTVKSGVITAKDAANTTIKLEKLDFATYYEVFSVAVTTNGLIGDVVRLQMRTSDTEPPAVDAISGTATVCKLTFTEPVQRGTGAIEVKSYSFKGNRIAATTVTLDEDAVACFGTEVHITVPEQKAGASLSVSLAEGAFLDFENNANEELKTTVKGVNADYVIQFNGFGWRVPSVPVKITAKEFNAGAPLVHAEWEDFVMVMTPSTPLAGIVNSKKGNIELIVKTTTKTVSHILEDFSITPDYSAVGFFLPEDPAPGARVDLKIPDGYFMDIYGNPVSVVAPDMSAAKWIAQYVPAQILHDYYIWSDDTESGDPDEDYLTVAPLAGGEDNEFTVTGFWGTSVEIPAVFDYDKGTLTLEDGNALVLNKYLVVLYGDEKNGLVFDVADNGSMTLRKGSLIEFGAHDPASKKYLGALEVVYSADLSIYTAPPAALSQSLKTKGAKSILKNKANAANRVLKK